ncbi:WUSCHEL-related homeobox 11-like protein [Cinnamomum micranthum f. kanehirae]|uniref:WUSCHEL-related homeobox 11-like protein n=1 Tax=Cinnamomum micranthum f. kanehirae TaxID=337451 RepID=A0A443NB99_9MAGN|nr:WUSCHEL-related homeobox 11-like protein [Cinnamomum micranthum f. kanehirae]
MEEDHVHESSNDPSQELERPEPVRSRWTPKPEQIMIMESIFNTGLVNPSKDETVRIRKQLEKFGSVADANVFYWFQNRRSRSRRRQRQIKALMANNPQILSGVSATGAIPYEHTPPLSVGSFASSSSSSPWVMAPSSCEAFDNNGGNNHFSVSQQMGSLEMEQMPMVSSIILPSNNANLHYQSGLITVFINGVPSEVPRGPLDMKAMFGQDVMLVHSSGEPVPVNEIGISLQSLQPGEHYFLVTGANY